MAGLVTVNYGIAIIPRILSLKHLNVKVLHIVNNVPEQFIYMARMKIVIFVQQLTFFVSLPSTLASNRILWRNNYKKTPSTDCSRCLLMVFLFL